MSSPQAGKCLYLDAKLARMLSRSRTISSSLKPILMKTIDSTPKKDGFRMPGEFELHTQTWMLWPERTDIWPFGAKPAQRNFAEIATAISKFEPVTMGASKSQYVNARQRLPSNIRVVELSYNGCWIRDTGPTFVVNGEGVVRGVDWSFNAWGGVEEGLYFPWDQDDLIAYKILDLESIDRYKAPFVLEGGAIHVDGQGTALATEECVLNPNRNSPMTKQQMENLLEDYLNVQKVIWLPKGLYLDETGGHIDNICCFVRPGVVTLAWTNDKSDPQYDISAEAYEILSASTDVRGGRLEIHKIEQPNPIYISQEESDNVDIVEGTVPRTAGSRLPASYINYYFVNGGIVMPLFEDQNDKKAFEKLTALFPDRKVVSVSTRQILFGGGNIHCNVQQQPK